MAKIGLTAGFTVIPEGTHVFKITETRYKEDFGKLEIDMVTADKMKHTERFSLLKQDGSPNDGAYNAFSFFAKTALNDFERTEVDPEELVGCFIRCEVTHEKVESRTQKGKFNTFARLGEKAPASGFDDDGDEDETPAPVPAAKKGNYNLDDILG